MAETFTITRDIARYSDHDKPCHRWSLTIDGVTVSELWVSTATGEIVQVETPAEHQGNGYATALYQAAAAEIAIYHAPEAHRTYQGDRFARSVGGDSLPCTDGCCEPNPTSTTKTKDPNMTSTITLPRPGSIHQITATYQLADGGWHTQKLDALILDATVDDDGVHVLWQPMTGTGADYLPDAVATESTFPRMEWPADTIRWDRSTTSTPGSGRPEQVGLGAVTGTYTPRDEAYNGVPVLREAARRALEQHAEWMTQPSTLRAEIRRVTALIAALPKRRDDLIRRAYAVDVPVSALADDADLSEARIYQIRDGRR